MTILQEELLKEKEKDLEKAEERGNALIQKGKGPACSVIIETLKGLKQSWACLDQMVNLFYPIIIPLLLLNYYCCL